MVSETVNLAQRLMSARKDRRLFPKPKALYKTSVSQILPHQPPMLFSLILCMP